MKRVINKILWLCFVAVVLTSCSKEEECDREDEDSPCYIGLNQGQFVRMELDGASWAATNKIGDMFFVISPYVETNTESGQVYHYIELVGLSSSASTGVTINFQLPPEKLTDPRGTYEVVADPRKHLQSNISTVMMYDVPVSGEGKYVSIFPGNLAEDAPLLADVGELVITDFELGKSSGDSPDRRIQRLKGTFSASTIYGMKDIGGATGEVRKIAKGEFSLINALYQ